MAELTQIQIDALKLIQIIVKQRKKYFELNNKIRELQGDFHTHVQFIDNLTFSKVIDLLDIILGDELASYFIFECDSMKDGGRIKLKGGKEYRLKTVSDLEIYLKERGY